LANNAPQLIDQVQSLWKDGGQHNESPSHTTLIDPTSAG